MGAGQRGAGGAAAAAGAEGGAGEAGAEDPLSFASLNAAAAELPPGCEGVTCLDHFQVSVIIPEYQLNDCTKMSNYQLPLTNRPHQSGAHKSRQPRLHGQE
jgi:hypothetical protein